MKKNVKAATVKEKSTIFEAISAFLRHIHTQKSN